MNKERRQVVQRIGTELELRVAAEIIRRAFRGVADEFGLTEANCPSHPAFLSDDEIITLASESMSFYALVQDEVLGVVGLQRLSESIYSMEKLAVLPKHRHLGVGKHLVESVCDEAAQAGAERMVIGIIDENTQLKQWYVGLGFSVLGMKRYPHLPFTVCTMFKAL